MEHKRAIEPLLYITQPSFEQAKPFMQENYSSLLKQEKVKEVEVKKEDIIEDVFPIRERKRRINPFFDLLEEDESEEDSENKKDETSDHVAFNDYTIEEKIKYFTGLPKEMPNIKCEIRTGDDRYRGYIMTDDGDEVLVKKGH